MKKVRPTGHPGAYVRENIIPWSDDLKGVAKIMGVRYSALRRFLMCETALSPELAERLELPSSNCEVRNPKGRMEALVNSRASVSP
jgi:plasmid maintenance system antidote protein VapI